MERLRYLVWLFVLFESCSVGGQEDSSPKLSWFVSRAENERIRLWDRDEGKRAEHRNEGVFIYARGELGLRAAVCCVRACVCVCACFG